jgi:hypothetical protein
MRSTSRGADLPGSQNLTLGGNITGTGSLVKNGASLLLTAPTPSAVA